MTGEIVRGLESVQRCYRILGIEVTRYRLSRRGQGGTYLGDDGLWQDAERQLATALGQLGLAYEDAAGEAAFYGPKIDVQVTDPAGREEHCPPSSWTSTSRSASTSATPAATAAGIARS